MVSQAIIHSFIIFTPLKMAAGWIPIPYAAQQSYHDTYLTKAQLIYILPPYLSEYMAQIKLV